MTKVQFSEKYGGLSEWEEAHPAASMDDHLWFKEKIAEEHERAEQENRKLKVNDELGETVEWDPEKTSLRPYCL